MTIAILVDTHILVWARVAPEKLSSEEREVLDTAQVRFVSAVTLWEIAILIALGRVGSDMRLLDLPIGFDLLPILPPHCKALVSLPQLHRDPFDRMLIAQSRVEDLALLTRDDAIIAYGRRGPLIVPGRDLPSGRGPTVQARDR